ASETKGIEPYSRSSPIEIFKPLFRFFVGGAGGARTHDRRIMRSTAPSTERAGCTDDTDHRIDGSRCAGIFRRAGPRTDPRMAGGNTPHPPGLRVHEARRGASHPGINSIHKPQHDFNMAAALSSHLVHVLGSTAPAPGPAGTGPSPPDDPGPCGYGYSAGPHRRAGKNPTESARR